MLITQTQIDALNDARQPGQSLVLAHDDNGASLARVGANAWAFAHILGDTGISTPERIGGARVGARLNEFVGQYLWARGAGGVVVDWAAADAALIALQEVLK